MEKGGGKEEGDFPNLVSLLLDFLTTSRSLRWVSRAGKRSSGAFLISGGGFRSTFTFLERKKKEDMFAVRVSLMCAHLCFC